MTIHNKPDKKPDFPTGMSKHKLIAKARIGKNGYKGIRKCVEFFSIDVSFREINKANIVKINVSMYRKTIAFTAILTELTSVNTTCILTPNNIAQIGV